MKKQNIIWIDVESSGIDANVESLLQVALRVTDENLEFLDGEGFERKVFFTPEEVTRMKSRAVKPVLDMHTETGLWDALLAGEGVPLNQLEEEIMEHVRKYVPEPRTARFAGNSITLDRNFINTYLPALGDHIHYRSYDVSTVAGLEEMWGSSNRMYHKKPSHEAMDDITESVNELRHYRALWFSNVRELAQEVATAQRALSVANVREAQNPTSKTRHAQTQAQQNLQRALENLASAIPPASGEEYALIDETVAPAVHWNIVTQQ